MASLGLTSITTSGLLAAFALALGADTFQIGILAAIPFIMQPLQIPAILLVEKFRYRKAIAVVTWFVAQLLWFPMALIPVFIEAPGAAAISTLLILMAIRSTFVAVTNCSWNSWVRDLVPQQILGRFFSRRLTLSTTAAAIFGLGAAFFIDYWRGQVPSVNEIVGYTYVLLFGALFLGMASPVLMSYMPEPVMQKAMGKQPSLWKTITMPFHDRNFRKLMSFLFFWSFALNMAVPFFAVYMLQRLSLPLSLVIGLSVLSQFFTILFLRVWGRLSDRFGSKAVLSVCASLYLLVILVWTFTTMPERYFLTIPLLVTLHIFAGIATAGVSLTIYTIGYKLAPQAQSAPYLAGASLATNVGAGIGPLVGGFLANFFILRNLSLDLTWIDPERTMRLGVLNLSGFDFLFALAFIIGLITLNLLAALREEGEAGKEAVLDELRTQTRSALHIVNTAPGPGFVGMFPMSYLSRVPGVDVAVGVTAYQLADTTKAITLAALRSHRATVRVARSLQTGLTRLWKTGAAIPKHDSEIARQAARGAMLAANETTVGIDRLVRSIVTGVVNSLDKSHVSPYDALRGTTYGIVEGSVETGIDVVQAVTEAVNTARENAHSLHLPEQEATQQAARGALEAVQTLKPQLVDQIKKALPSDLLQKTSEHSDEVGDGK